MPRPTSTNVSAPPADSPTASLGPSTARVFWTAFALLALVTAAWSLSSPLAAGPDENAHIIKAAAVVRGQLDGGPSPSGEGSGTVTVPHMYSFMMVYQGCFAYHEDISAGCVPQLPPDSDMLVTASTWMIRNNPVYYAVVGLPTLLPAGEYTVHLMRLLANLMGSAVLAWGLTQAMSLRRTVPVALGAVAAVTPMVVYLNSVVNSSGLEVSTAIALWLSLLVLVHDPRPDRLRSRAAAIGVLVAILGNTRGLAPLYILVIVAVALAWRPRGLVTVLADRRAWPWVGVAVLGTAAGAWWTLRAGTLEGGGDAHPELTFLSVARQTLLDTSTFVTQSVGHFGWLDASLPTTFHMAYAALAGTVVLGAAIIARRRGVLLIASVALVAVALPVVVHAWQARNVGYIWTGRYSMPLLLGVPLVAGFAAHGPFGELPARLDRRLGTVVLAGAGLLNVAALFTLLRRYVTGGDGSWLILLGGEWDPPLPPVVLLAVATVAWTVATVAFVRTVGSSESADDTADDAPQDADRPDELSTAR